jgi:hypothetical protein
MDNKSKDKAKIGKPDNQLPKSIARPEIMKNYAVFKNFIIRFKRDRECTWDVDYIEATDLAWELAEQLPEGIILDDSELNRGAMQPEGPNWFDMLCIFLVIVAAAFFTSYILVSVFLT